MTALYYVHDPMCSWCYAFAPTWKRIEAALPPGISVDYVVGGLAPDSDQPMPPQLRDYIQRTWRHIESAVPGTEFNFDFWTRCTPRRSTYPACRAVLTVRHFDAALERPMIAGIQRAYYRDARNPADVSTLCDIAVSLGVEEQGFLAWIASTDCEAALARQLSKARAFGIVGFPSLVLETGSGHWRIPHSYTDPRPTLAVLESVSERTCDDVSTDPFLAPFRQKH